MYCHDRVVLGLQVIFFVVSVGLFFDDMVATREPPIIVFCGRSAALTE